MPLSNQSEHVQQQLHQSHLRQFFLHFFALAVFAVNHPLNGIPVTLLKLQLILMTPRWMKIRSVA